MDIKNWSELTTAERQDALSRPAQSSADRVRQSVQEIIANIRQDDDTALMRYSRELDHYEGTELELSADDIKAAASTIDPALKAAIEQAYKNLSAFHAAQVPEKISMETFPGITCEVATHPIDKVGLYVPGGSAPLFSTALMLAVPARLAGCPEIILCSPPPIAPAIVYAASLAGVKRIFNLGGAQAISAMAYGTGTVPKVYKIFGPGNQYVTCAKTLVSQDPQGAAIDMPAGPSEVMVIADSTADARYVAADLLSQAEHGPDSQALLVTTDGALAEAVLSEINAQLETLPRKSIAESALAKSSIIVAPDLEACCNIACAYAPEHLIVETDDPRSLLPKLHNAGSIFLGSFTPESLGDYASGTNHTLPTYGYARTAHALGTADFRRRYTIQSASAQGLQNIAPTVEIMAKNEGLEAHRRAVAYRVGHD